MTRTLSARPLVRPLVGPLVRPLVIALVISVTALGLLACSAGGSASGRPSGAAAHSATAPDDAAIEAMAFARSDASAAKGASCLGATTCQASGANCGPLGDGCGHVLDCGRCSPGETCGGGGTPSVCGKSACAAKTCEDQGIRCGPAGDGCGNALDCGSCQGTATCGGGGVAGDCGEGAACQARSCADQGVTCGPAGDGCGNALDCGSCTGAETCGGEGVPGRCGAPACRPLACLADACGLVADGCGGLLNCGGCALPKACNALTAGRCGVPATCTNLCLQQVSCPNAGTTALTGTVYAPNGVDPLPNVLAYIPNAPVDAFAATVSCDKCSSGVSGSPLVSTASGPDGSFTLTNVPAGTDIPLVLQTGRWRRQVRIPSVPACASTEVPAPLTRLPRSRSEGDIPHMAFATGSVDALECVLRKVGVQDTEFTPPSGGGRVALYVGDGQTEDAYGETFPLGGANAGPRTPGEAELVGSAATLASFDMVFFPCQGDEWDRSAAEQDRLIDYANAGGRVFATHYSYVWLFDDSPFRSTAAWDVGQCDAYTSADGCNQTPGYPPDQTGFIDTSFPKGETLAEWLVAVKASASLGQIAISTLRWDLDGVVPPSQLWMQIHDPRIGSVPMHYTFNTPISSPPDQQCGRVLFDDFHVENHGYVDQGSAYGLMFPDECDDGPMTPQEKLLEFMIFDLGSCVAPDQPSCTPTTCAAQGIGCGPAGDGCGGTLDCGACQVPDTCGGGGTPSRCGSALCTARTCASQGVECGPAGDGCGGALDCGTCVAPTRCGGSGTPGRCGVGSMCTPRGCGQQGIECGPAGDGCGGTLDCGSCPAGRTCGGGGVPGACGSDCVAETCASLGFDCGVAGDGCGGELQCGACTLPQTCGGGGRPNVCGGAAQ